MNKLFVSLVCVAIALSATLVAAVGEHQSSKLANELEEESASPDGGLDSLGSIFGRNDVLEDGVGSLHDQITGDCRSSKNEAACRTCCGITDKAYSYSLAANRITKFSLHRCICFERSPNEKVFRE